MARFYGELQGARGEVTRLGHQSLHTAACSWSGCVRTIVRADGETDRVSITAERHGSSKNPEGVVFDGTFEDLGQLVTWWERRDEINAIIALTGK